LRFNARQATEIEMRLAKSVLLASSLLATSAFAARAEINVVASIKPVHSLVAAVMQGVDQPGLLVEGAGSPHTYAMKPSEAAMLEKADLVFWIGPEIETFLEKPLETLSPSARTVELLDAHGLVKLELREGGAFEDHGHGDEDGHAEHRHAEHTDHDSEHKQEEKADHDHDHDHGHDEKEERADADHDHGHDEFDAHVWLDPVNAKVLVHEIEEALAEVDPANAATYEANAKAVMARLDALTAETAASLEPVKDKGFIVFHDAYQNFEHRFGLTALGAITVSPEIMPGAERVSELRAKVQGLDATCVFSEPQFEPKLVATITEGTSAKSGVLDPLGASLREGPDLYFNLIRDMAASFRDCLSEAS
jgi:zinc transport system substrate-binding protein